MPNEPTPAEAMYGGSAEMSGHKKTLEKALGIGLKSLGFGGGTMGLVQEIVDAFDHNKLLSPMQRLNEHRMSPEYKGRKPSAGTREEIERLRTPHSGEFNHTILNME